MVRSKAETMPLRVHYLESETMPLRVHYLEVETIPFCLLAFSSKWQFQVVCIQDFML
jgi:hypothetical protein